MTKIVSNKLKKITLDGKSVRLEPLRKDHMYGLAKAIEDGELWKIPVTFIPHPQDLVAFFEFAEEAFHEGRELTFAVIDKITGEVAGSTRFRCIEFPHRRAEIGFTFLRLASQRTHINTEAKYLLLQHAFERWELNRIELLTDFLNTKSRNAITRIGATEEGILRNHMVMRDGRIRDSVMFSIVHAEWPAVKASLLRKLEIPSSPCAR